MAPISCSTTMITSAMDQRPMRTSTIFDPAEAVIDIPIIAKPPKKSASIYVSPIFGIEFLEILADQKKIRPEPSYELLDDVDFRTISLQDQSYLYILKAPLTESEKGRPIWEILVADRIEEDDFSLTSYKIPQETKQIQITYHVRYSDNSYGETHTLTLLSTTHFSLNGTP